MRSRNSNWLLAVVVIGLSISGLSAQTKVEGFARGVVIDKVVSQADTNQTYALYLPSTYTPGRKFPILYCLDPGARGSLPVALFKNAAEKYEYIIVGSNNSRNGPNQSLSDIINVLWDDTHARFSIDEQRVYAAGFSGGARVAIALGYSLKGLIAGIIACSAGYPGNIKLSTPPPFVLFGTAGTDDFNQPEVDALDAALDKLKAPHQITFFAGGHEWPPAQLATAALAWMELQAIKTGRSPKDDVRVSKLFEQAVERARTFESTGDLYSAYRFYESLVEDFAGLRDVADSEKKVVELRSAKSVRETLNYEHGLGARQQKLAGEIQTIVLGLKSNQFIEDWSKLRSIIKDLKSQSRQADDSADRRIARRSLDQLVIGSFETAVAAHAQRDFRSAAFFLEVAIEVKPDDPGLLYTLARSYAAGARKKKAIETLKRAVSAGFCNVSRLQREADLGPLRNEAGYKEIEEELRKPGCQAKP